MSLDSDDRADVELWTLEKQDNEELSPKKSCTNK